MKNFFVKEPNIKDLELYDSIEIKSLVRSYNYCFDYLSNFQDFEMEEFRKILDICNEIMTQEIIDIIPDLNKNHNMLAYERLFKLIIETLKKKINGISIGDILIRDSIEEGKVFTIPELAYDCQIQYEQIGLSRLPRFYHISNKSKFYGITDFYSQDILINGYSNFLRKQIGKNKEKARDINLNLLLVIRHEIQHAKQGKEYRNKSEGKIMSELIEFENYLYQNFSTTSVYHAYHDLFPTEYEADIISFEKAILDLSTRYKTSFSKEMIEQIYKLYYQRQNNYTNNPLNEIISYIFEVTKNSNLPENQRVKMLEMLDKLQTNIDDLVKENKR